MKAVICMGLPGCGKSTYAAWNPEMVEINRDAARLALNGNVTDHSREGLVTRFCENQMIEAAGQKKDILISDTNLSKRRRKKLIEFLRDLDFDSIEGVLFNVSMVTCLERNKDRDKPVPEQVIEKMALDLTNQPPTLDEGFDSIVLEEQKGAKRIYEGKFKFKG